MHEFIAIIITWLQLFSSYTLRNAEGEDLLFPCGPRDCSEVKACWIPNLPLSLVYPVTINVPKSEASASGAMILCHVDSSGTPWTILLIKSPEGPAVSFDRTWSEYENGFGTKQNFWLGLKRIHRMTASRLNVMKQEQASQRDMAFYCDHFSVDDADHSYTLRLGNCIGHDQISKSRDAPFSTPDRDSSPDHCAKANRNGWWYNTCGDTSLNVAFDTDNVTGLPKGIEKLSFAQVEFREEQPRYSCDKTCPNGGTCRAIYNKTTLYTCECAPGYTGWRCEQSKCPEVPCENNGTCSSNGSCSCLPSYTGNRCETALACIDGAPCSNGGRCTADKTCVCTEGYSGALCELIVPEGKTSEKDAKTFYSYVVAVTGCVIFTMVFVSAVVRIKIIKGEMLEKRRRKALGYEDDNSTDTDEEVGPMEGETDARMARLEWERKLGRTRNVRQFVDGWYKKHHVGLDDDNGDVAAAAISIM